MPSHTMALVMISVYIYFKMEDYRNNLSKKLIDSDTKYEWEKVAAASTLTASCCQVPLLVLVWSMHFSYQWMNDAECYASAETNCSVSRVNQPQGKCTCIYIYIIH